MNLPRTPKKDEPVIHFAKEVIAWMRANTINNVLGGRAKRSPNGTTIEVLPPTYKDHLGGEDAFDSHPWKVSNSGTGSAFVNAGFVHFYYMTYANSSGSEGPNGFGGPDSIVAGPAVFFDGGTISVTGTQYIYAEMTRNQSVDCYCQADGSASTIVVTKLINEISPVAWVDEELAEEAVLVASDDSPDLYIPTSGYVARCIARVTNVDGVITTQKQYITHNFDMFIPVVENIVADNS